ncbi:hypothetical protein, partial [Aeromonas enteropelogenes]|uniref:hypothetical protein n=1 Tax=Aeromonas enteropelogenes TaxID=29489 RepID=UPI00398A4B0D
EPAGMTTIGLSYSLVKISTKCAPALGEAQVLQKWQVEADKWLAEQLEHERQEIKRREQNRLAREEERQRHIEIVQLRERQLQERSQQTQVADRKGEPSLSPSLISKSCKHCQLVSPALDHGGYCARQSCVQSRQQSFRSPLASRYQYGKERHSLQPSSADTWWSQSMSIPTNKEPRMRMCRYCGESMVMGPNGWWCDHCEDK